VAARGRCSWCLMHACSAGVLWHTAIMDMVLCYGHLPSIQTIIQSCSAATQHHIQSGQAARKLSACVQWRRRDCTGAACSPATTLRSGWDKDTPESSTATDTSAAGAMVLAPAAPTLLMPGGTTWPPAMATAEAAAAGSGVSSRQWSQQQAVGSAAGSGVSMPSLHTVQGSLPRA
jgi:hypothetical protein